MTKKKKKKKKIRYFLELPCIDYTKPLAFPIIMQSSWLLDQITDLLSEGISFSNKANWCKATRAFSLVVPPHPPLTRQTSYDVQSCIQ